MNAMKLAGLALSFSLTVLPSLAAMEPTAERDPAVMSQLNGAAIDKNTEFWRGGTKRPLGLYHVGKVDTEFRSGYKDVPLETKLKFAYDLSQFLKGRNLDYDSFVKNFRFTSVNEFVAQRYPQMDKAVGAFDKACPAARNFADKWWLFECPDYKKTPWPLQRWWINDALLDGADLSLRAQEYAPNNHGDPQERLYYDTGVLNAWASRDDQMSPFGMMEEARK